MLKRPLKEKYIKYLLDFSKKNNKERNEIKDGTLQKSELTTAIREGALALEKVCAIENLEGFFYLKDGKIYSTNGLNDDLNNGYKNYCLPERLIIDVNEEKYRKLSNNEIPLGERTCLFPNSTKETNSSDEKQNKKVNWDLFFTGEVEIEIEDYIDILLLLEKSEEKNIDISYYKDIRNGKNSFVDYGKYWYFDKNNKELMATNYSCESDNVNICFRMSDYILEHTYYI